VPDSDVGPVEWRVRGRTVAISKPLIIGILNVTPDSFSDGGLFEGMGPALHHVQRMVAEGADGVDVGGESTRPQTAKPVSADEEYSRVIPVIGAIRSEFPDLLLSVDTTKGVIARAALDAGAEVINDVSGFRIDPSIREIVASSGAGVVLMHSRGNVTEMATYKYADYTDDVIELVGTELARAAESARAGGVRPEHIVLDPGIGFAKRTEHSLRLVARLDRITRLGFPVMVGASRKRFIGELSGVRVPSERVAGTIAANVMALAAGARLFRVHDVGPNRQALDVAWAVVRARDANAGGRSPDSRPPDFGRLPSIPDSP
jgi:dihydropteroate synthase